MIDLPLALGDDSEDLALEEVEQAIPVPNVESVIERLKATQCSCGGAILVKGHALRRRAPHLYWRLTLGCAADVVHETTMVFRADWLST